MKPWLLSLLACPRCEVELELEMYKRENGDPYHGLFGCNDCATGYMLVAGIPRFVELEHIKGSQHYKSYYDEFGERVQDADLRIYNTSPEQSLSDPHEQTTEYFGHEWDTWQRWGWHDPDEVSDSERQQYSSGLTTDTERDLTRKSPLSDEEVTADKFVLDGGCGNGRFTYQAAKNGARTVGVDLGAGSVEAAENCRDEQNIQIMQANLFELPFRPREFDHVFSIGVLHHSGDAEGAFDELTNYVKPGGTITAHVYHEGNIVWEWVTDTTREFTTDLSVRQNMRLAAALAKFARLVGKIPNARGYLNLITRLQTTQIQMFDWYSAPIATRHTYGEVINWFTKRDFVVLETNLDGDYGSRIIKKPWVASVKGRYEAEA